MRESLLIISVLVCGVILAVAPFALTGEQKGPETNPAVQANNDFSCDLYKRLGQENAGKNVFFSPYSISSALAMTLEGARGETADEMGKVLNLPASLRETGANAKVLPWKTAPYQLGFNALNRRFNESRDAAKDQALRQKLLEMRGELAKLNAKIDPRNADGKILGEATKLAEAINTLSKQVDQYELRVANSVWAEKTYPFDLNYFDAITKYYGGDLLRQADFRNNFPKERKTINDWVENQTKNRIKDLVPDYPPQVARLIRMILVNAIYFKGQWAMPFDPKQTKVEDFLLANGSKMKTPLMHLNHDLARYAAFNSDGTYYDTPTKIPRDGKVQTYPDGNGFLMAELPVKGEKLAWLVFAPQKADGLPALEARLTGQNLAAWVGKLQRRSVNVALPKFKLETDYSLKDTLQNMGMKLAFVPRVADFTGMSTSTDPDDRLYISAVLHKAFVEVNEEGSEAAAATAVIMAVPLSAPATTPFTPNFRADRPFVFLLRDTETGTVLFLGRVTQPSAAPVAPR